MGFLNFKFHQPKGHQTDSKPDDSTETGLDHDISEPAEESSERIPLDRLRDLRPEKDPIGARNVSGKSRPNK